MTLSAPVLHPELSALEFLLGTWVGTGTGGYPGSEPFEYTEELSFAHEGKPVLAYAMRTSRLGDGAPSHAERGFWRCRDSSGIESVVAHATGHAEVSVGSIDFTTVTLESTSVVGWTSSKDVVAVSRTLSLDGDVLTDALGMQAVGHALQAHVMAKLQRK